MSRGEWLYRLLWSPLKRTVKFLWYGRSRFPFLNFPILCWLPYGGRFFAYGDEMGLSIFKSSWFLGRTYDENENKFISRFIKPGFISFDIGANQGFYTIFLAKLAGSQGKVFAFEPAPSEFRKLRWNMLINRLRNVVMESLALGCQEGSSDMYLCLSGKGSYSSLRSPSEDVKARKKLIRVAITTLDAYIQHNNIPTIDFIKIDVEGGELDVLKGGIDALSRLRPVIMCEIADIRTRQWGYRASEIYKFLAEHGYRWYRTTTEGTLQFAEPKERYDPEWENLIAVPVDKNSQLSSLMRGAQC